MHFANIPSIFYFLLLCFFLSRGESEERSVQANGAVCRNDTNVSVSISGSLTEGYYIFIACNSSVPILQLAWLVDGEELSAGHFIRRDKRETSLKYYATTYVLYSSERSSGNYVCQVNNEYCSPGFAISWKEPVNLLALSYCITALSIISTAFVIAHFILKTRKAIQSFNALRKSAVSTVLKNCPSMSSLIEETPTEVGNFTDCLLEREDVELFDKLVKDVDSLDPRKNRLAVVFRQKEWRMKVEAVLKQLGSTSSDCTEQQFEAISSKLDDIMKHMNKQKAETRQHLAEIKQDLRNQTEEITENIIAECAGFATKSCVKGNIVESMHLKIVSNLGSSRLHRIGSTLMNCDTAGVNDLISGYRVETNSDKLLAILEDWVKKEGDNATIEKLLEVCEEVDIRGAVVKEMEKRGCVPEPVETTGSFDGVVV